MILKEYDTEEESFLKNILKSLRDKIFHYREEEAQKWFDKRVKDCGTNTKAQRELIKYISLENPTLDLGQEYDAWLNSDHLIFNKNRNMELIFQNLLKVQKLQGAFLELKHSITRFLIEGKKPIS